MFSGQIAMARKKAKTIPSSAGNADQLQTKVIEGPKKKKYKSPSTLASNKKRDSLRMSTFNREIQEKILRIGMSICEDALRAKGFDVKQEEDKTEKFDFDREHVKKVTFGEFSYPSGSPSQPSLSETGSVSSHYPVRGIMRKFARKTISKAIKQLEEKVQMEEDRGKVEDVIEELIARNNLATRRAMAAVKKINGRDFEPVLRQEEKLRFLIQPRAASLQRNMCRAASSRALAMLQKAQKA
jgi:hypothetical protein